ncbi:uncharacterized protein LOC114735538 [Neltuma alba]|uniref:uncharacterized protein LOC114735538 n=1 Tax=Neltuma alba TaxID=207710 RepID=UPI0010A4EFBC|nr:uncharacterized protein LOC114735538 [Prosopis alba]
MNASPHNDSATINLDFPPLEPDVDVRIVGSCRGILLLQIEKKQEKRLFLWNPVITGTYKQITQPPECEYVIPFVFCYHESMDDYLIGLSYYIPSRWREVLEVLSLREKIDLKCCYYCRKPVPNLGTFWNGAIHFIAYRYGKSFPAELIAFDITTKDIRKAHLPIEHSNFLEKCRSVSA